MDYQPDTPVMTEIWCPTCSPDRNPVKDLLEVRYCAEHVPSWSGSEDGAVVSDGFLAGSAEAGDVTNRLFCAWVHRATRPA